MATRDPQPWMSALRSSHDRLKAAVAPLGPDAVVAPSMAADWTIAQVLSHLGSQAEIFTAILDAAVEGRQLPGPDAFPPIWDAWNGKTPQDQVTDSVAANEAFLSQVGALSTTQMEDLRFALFGMDLDMVGVLRMRLSEQALHSWDVLAALDPAATVSPDAVELLIDTLSEMASRVGKPQGEPMEVRIVTTGPARDLALVVNDHVRIEPDGGSPDAVVRLPAEAFLRLVYGRLDDAHAPPIEVEGGRSTLDRLRAVFPALIPGSRREGVSGGRLGVLRLGAVRT